MFANQWLLWVVEFGSADFRFVVDSSRSLKGALGQKPVLVNDCLASMRFN